jgi:DNA-binding transcriptional LysR family regulator
MCGRFCGLVVRDDAQLMIEMAERGLGLTYTFEPMVTEQLRAGRSKLVLEPYSATVPGFK